MPRAALVVLGAVPAAAAILIAVPLITFERVPSTATLPDDELRIEYALHRVLQDPLGISRTVSYEVLSIDASGAARLVASGAAGARAEADLGEIRMQRLTALVKETGLMEIQPESFPARDGAGEHLVHVLAVELNDQSKSLRWADPESGTFVPPILVMVADELGAVADGLRVQ